MKTNIPDTYIKFLPSEHDNGFKATIRNDLGDAWASWRKWYGHLRGVAEYPPEWFRHEPWAVKSILRLKEQGVEFV